ncbi:restriction endonuclease subunit S, partial [Tabrizicola sp.]|uniref:restriction endonuclease subunit S n=1 Tax=Tabrizicola sp. TaxID=2005166 RepID=UPI002735F742
MKRVPLGTALNFFNGKAVFAEESGKYPVYGSNGIIGFTAKHKYENSIIIGRVGAYCGSINYERGKYWASDNTIVADTKPEYSIEFLSFLLEALPLNSLAGGSAQPLLNQTILSRIDALIPNFGEQKKIAAILSTYDELIENNQRRIALLEKMAEEIYREWFVRLRFPGHEKVKIIKGAPEGWKLVKLEHAFKFTGGGTPTKEVNRYWVGGDVNWFTPSDITGANGIFL